MLSNHELHKVDMLPHLLMENMIDEMPKVHALRRVADGGIVSFGPDSDLSFNRASGFRQPLDRSTVRDLVSFFRGQGLRSALLVLSETATPGDWEAIRTEFGFAEGPILTKLIARTAVALAQNEKQSDPDRVHLDPSVAVRPVSFDEAESAAQLAATVFQVRNPSPLSLAEALLRFGNAQLFGAFDGPKMIGMGVVEWAAGMAYLSSAGTLVEHRGRGVQQGLIRARMFAAAEAGCTLVSVDAERDSSGPSMRNLLRAGFQPSHDQTVWLWNSDRAEQPQ